MNKVYRIHDKVFKKTMSDIRVARDFFEEYLPEKVLSLVDLNTLSLTQNSFVDEELKDFRSDILYEVKLKEGHLAYFYLLCEHQSSVDPLMPFRLLNYMVKIWQLHLEQTDQEFLPLIFPLVFFHGKKPYDGPRVLSELIQGPAELLEAILLKPFHLVDTHDIQDEDLREQTWLGILIFVFKHVFARDIEPFILPLIERLKAIQEDKGASVFTSRLLKYWLCASEIKEKDPKSFVKTVQEQLSKSIGDELMTMAEQLIQQGRLEGRMEGRLEGIELGVEKGVQKGEGTLLIHLVQLKFKLKALPEHYRQQIEEAHPEQLVSWAEKVLEARSLEEIFTA